jgi:iron complex transport system permease protein
MKKIVPILLSLAFLNLIAVIISFSVGSSGFSLRESVFGICSALGFGRNMLREDLYSILFQVRLPRILLAFSAGGGLAIAGVVFQLLVRNVLADPYILGVSSGASLGALLSFITGFESMLSFGLPLCSFFGAALVIIIVHFFGNGKTNTGSTALLLTGVMTSAFLSAGIVGVIAVNGDPMRNILFWLIGYLGHATTGSALFVVAVILPVSILTTVMSPRLNIMSLGSETARGIGLNFKSFQILMYFFASLLTASIVAFTGPIGFVGLVVPHITRRIFGSDNRIVIPAAFMIGSLFLIISDLISRILFSPQELPVGVVTSAIGAPLFIYLLRRRN